MWIGLKDLLTPCHWGYLAQTVEKGTYMGIFSRNRGKRNVQSNLMFTVFWLMYTQNYFERNSTQIQFVFGFVIVQILNLLLRGTVSGTFKYTFCNKCRRNHMTFSSMENFQWIPWWESLNYELYSSYGSVCYKVFLLLWQHAGFYTINSRFECFFFYKIIL